MQVARRRRRHSSCTSPWRARQEYARLSSRTVSTSCRGIRSVNHWRCSPLVNTVQAQPLEMATLLIKGRCGPASASSALVTSQCARAHTTGVGALASDTPLLRRSDLLRGWRCVAVIGEFFACEHAPCLFCPHHATSSHPSIFSLCRSVPGRYSANFMDITDSRLPRGWKAPPTKPDRIPSEPIQHELVNS
jgi:hypothetical protein